MATAAPEKLDLAQVTATYVKIRNAKAERRKAWEAEEEAFDSKLAMLEGVMLRHLNTHGMESVRTEAGTFYKQEDLKPSCGDWSAFYKWIAENDAFEALEKRVGKGFITDFMKAHDGLLPPGINVHREYVVRVRKPQ